MAATFFWCVRSKKAAITSRNRCSSSTANFVEKHIKTLSSASGTKAISVLALCMMRMTAFVKSGAMYLNSLLCQIASQIWSNVRHCAKYPDVSNLTFEYTLHADEQTIVVFFPNFPNPRTIFQQILHNPIDQLLIIQIQLKMKYLHGFKVLYLVLEQLL